MKQNKIILQISDLSKSFNNEIVLNNISLQLRSGKIYGLLGKNGAGKTTLLKSILGLIYLDRGNIIFDDINIENGKNVVKKSQIGSLIEYPMFPLNYTVKQVLNEQQYMMNVKVSNNYLDNILLLLGLNLRLEEKVKNLSLGWKQKLGILRATCNFPKLLILDEPFNGLDPLAIQQVEELLEFLVKQNICVIISSHIIQELQNIADEFYFVKDHQVTFLNREYIKGINIKDYYLSKFQ